MDRLNLTSTREIPSKSINFVSDRSESQDSSTVSGNIAEKRNLDSSSLEPLSRGPKVSSLKPSADSDFSAKTPETLLSGSTPASGVMDPSLEGSISTLQGDHQLLSTRSHQSLSQAFQVGDGIIAELPTGVHALGSPSRSMYENHQTQLYDSGSSTASEESILQSLETSLEVFPRVSSPLEPTNLEVGFEQVSVETDPEPSLPRQLSDESAPVRRFASSRSSVESFSAITRAAVQPSRSRRVSGDSFLGEERFPSKKPSLDSLSSLSRKASKDELIEASLQETIESSRFGIVSAKELPVLEEVTEELDAPQLAHSNFEDQQWLSHGSSIPRTSFSHKSEQQNFEAETTAGGAQDLRPSIFSENASRTYSMSRSSESTLSYLEQELGSNNNDHLQQRVSVETNNVRFSKDSKLGFKEDELAAQVANTGQETCFIEDSRADEVMTSASRAMSIDKAFESSIVDSSKSEIHPAVNQLNKSDFQNSGEERKVDLNDYQTYIEHSTSRNPQNQILEVKGVQSISWADDEIKKIPELMSYQTSDPSETIYSSGVPPKPSLSEDTQAASSPISDIEKLNTARSDDELNEIVNLVELKNAISPTVTASQAHETSTTNSEIHSNIYHTESWRAKTSFQSNNEVIEGQSDPEFDANLTSALLVTDFRFTQDAEPGPSKASNFNLSHLSTGLPLGKFFPETEEAVVGSLAENPLSNLLKSGSIEFNQGHTDSISGIKIEEKPLEFSSGSYSQCLSDVDENSNGGVVKNQNSLFELPSNADYSSLTRASEMAEDSTIVEVADLSRRGTLVIDPNDQKTVTIEVENVFEQENLLNREEEEESFSRADQDGFENENSMTVAQDKRQIIFEQAVDTSTEQSSHKVRPEETQELPSFYESFKDSAQIGDSNREESDHSPLMSTNAEEAVIPIQETAPSDDEASNRNIEENDIKAFYLPPTTSSLNSQVLLANDVTISQGLSVKDSITHEVALQEEEDFNVEEYESISKYHISDSNTETIHATELDTSPADAISRLHEHQVHHISDTKDLDSSLLGDILADSDRRRVFANVTGEGDRELIYEVQSAETTLKSFGSRDFSDAIRQVMPSNGKDDQARDNDITSSLRDWSIEAAHKSEVDSLREDIDGLAAPSALLKSETSNQADESLAKSESDAPTSTRDKADKGPIQFSSKNETAFTHKFIQEPHPISYEISNSENVYDLLTPTESAANASRIIHEEPPFVTLSEQNLEVTSGDGEEDEIIESKTASMETQVPAELQKLESEELANAVESQREVKDTNSRSVVTVAVKSLTGDVDDASTASDPEKHESAVAAEPNLLEFSGASLSDGAIADEKEAIEFLEERGTFAIPDSNVAAIKRAQQSETVAELTPVTRSLATEEEFTTAHNNEIYPTVSKIPESIEADNANSTQKVEGDIHASVNSFEATADLNVTINEKTKGEPPDILQSGVAKTSVAAYEVTTTPDFYEVNADTSYGLNKNRGAEKICSPDYPIELNNVLQSAEPVSSSTPTEDLTKKESEDMGGTLLPSADSTIGTTVVDSDKKVDSGGEINLDPQPRSDEVELVQESSNGSLIVENENETKSEADSYEALATDELPVVLADAISQTQASPLAEVKHEAVTDIEDTKVNKQAVSQAIEFATTADFKPVAPDGTEYLIGPDDLTSLDSKDLNQLADPISTSLPVKDSTGHEDEDTSEDQLLADQADAGVDKEDKSVTETLILAPDEARGEASILGEVVKTVDQPLASEDEVEPKQVGNLDAEINRSTDVEVENVEILTGVQEDAELHPLSPKEEDVTNMEGLKRGLTITEEVSAALAIESIITDRALREPSAGNDGLFADVVVEENAGDVEVQPPLLTEEVIVTNVEGVKEGLSLTEEVPAAYVIESSTADRSLPEPSAESYGLVADVVAEEKTSTAEVQPPSSTEGGILRHLEDVKKGLSSTDVVLAPTKIESSIEDQDLPEPSAEIDGVVANVVVEEKASAVELQPPLSTDEDIVTYVEGVKKELPITKEVFAAPEIESIITDQALPVHYAESESVAAFDTVDDSTILVDGINLEPQSSTDETKASCQEPGDVPFVVVSSDETKNETDSHVDLATENLNLDLADSILQTQPTLEAESEREVVVDIEEAKVSEQTALEGVDSATKADSALVASEGAKNLTFQEDDDLLQPEEAITASAADTAEKECEDLRETCLIVEQADAGNDEKAKITAKASPESLDVVIRQETFSKEVVQSFNHASASENEDEFNPAENAKQEDEDNNPVNFEEENGRSLSDGKEETYIQPPASTGADTAAKLEGGEEGLLITEEVSAKISADVKDDSQGHTAPLTEEGIVTHEEGERGSLLVAEEVHTKPVIESTTADQNLSESSTECKSEVAVDTVNEKAISGRAIHLDPQSSKDETDLSVQKPGDVALALDSADETREEANCHKDSAAGELLLVAADVISQIPAVHIAKVEREAMKEREEIEVDEQATLKEEESSAEAEFLKIASEAADNLPGPSHFDPSDSANAHQRIEPTSTPREISNEQDSIDTNESHLKADQTNAVDDKLVGFVAKTLRYGQDVIEGEVPISEEVEKTSDQLPSVDDEAELNLVDNAGAEVDSPVDVEDDIAEIMPDGIEASQVQLPSLTDEGVSTHVEEEKESVFAATLEQSSTTPVMDLPELSAESESVVEVNTANVIAIFVDSKNQDTQPSLDETESAGQDSGDLSFAVDSVDETKNEADSHEALAAGGISTVSTGAISQPQAATLAEIETEALKDNKEGKAAAKNDEESDTKDLSVSFTIAGAENQPGPEELQLMNPANVLHLLEEPFSDHTEDITKQDINESQLATDQAGTDNVMQTAIVDENLPSELSATEGKAPIAEVLKTIDRSPASEDEVELKLVENAEAEVDSPTDVGKASTQAPPAAPSSENENEELINSEDTIVAEKIDSQVEEPATKVGSGLFASEEFETSPGPEHLYLHNSTGTHQLAEDSSKRENEETRQAHLAVDLEEEGVEKQAEIAPETISDGPDGAEFQDSITEKAVHSSDHEQSAKDDDEVKLADHSEPEVDSPVLVEEENVGSLLGEENETYVQPPSSTGENVSAIVEEVNEGKAVLEKVRTVLEMESASIELALPEPSAECEIGVADVAVDNNAITLIDVQNVEGGEEVVLITREASAAPVIESASPEVNLPEPSAECESLVADVTIDDKTIPGEDVPNVEDAEERLSNKEEVSALPEIRSTIACQALPEPSAESKCEVADETAEENDIPVEAVNPEPEPSPDETENGEQAAAEVIPAVKCDEGIKVELGSLDVTATQEAPTAANENSPSIQPTPSAESEPEALKDNEEDNVDEQDSRKVEETATKSDSALVASEGDEILAGSEGLNQHDLTVAQRLAVTISDPADDLTPSKCDDVPVPGNGDQLKLVDKIKAEDDNSINVEDNNLVNVADGKDETHVQLLVSSDEVIVAKVAGVEEGLTATEKFSAVPEIERASTELVLPEPSAECESEFADGIVDDKAATPVEAVNQESQPSPDKTESGVKPTVEIISAVDCAAEELPPSIQPTPSVENEREALKSNEEANVDEQDGSQVAETATKAVSALVASECEEILANSEDLSRLDSNYMPNLAEPMSAVVEDVTQQNSGDTNEVELVTTETVDVDDKQVEIVVESTPSGPDVDEIEESTTEKVAQSSDHERAADDQHDFRPVDNLEVEVDNPTDIEGENTCKLAGEKKYSQDQPPTWTGEDIVTNAEVVEEGLLITEEVSVTSGIECALPEAALPQSSAEREPDVFDVIVNDKAFCVEAENLESQPSSDVTEDVEQEPGEVLSVEGIDDKAKVEVDFSKDMATEDLPVVPEEASTQDQPAATLSENKYQELLDSESTNADEQANSQVEEPASKVNSGPVASEAETSQGPGHLDLHAPTATHQFAEPISAPLEELIIEESEEARLAPLATHHEDEGDAKQTELKSETVSAGLDVTEGQDSINEKAVLSSDHEQTPKDGDEIKPGDNAHPEDNNTINIEEENVGSLLDGKEKTGEDALANSQVVEEGLPITEEVPAVPVIESALTGTSVKCDGGTTVDAVNDKAISVENVGDNVEGAVNVMPTSEDASAVPVIESTTPELGLSDSCVEGDIVMADVAVESNALHVEGVSNEEALEEELPIKGVVSALQELESASPEVALPEPSTESKSGIAADTVEKALSADLINPELAPDETQIDKPSAECESGVADFTVDDNATPTENVVPNMECLGEGQPITQEVSTVPEAESDSQELALSNPSVEREIEEVDVAPDDKTHPGEDLLNEEVVEEGLSIKEEVCAVPDVESASAEKTFPEPSFEFDSKVKADPSEDIAAEDLPAVSEGASTQDHPAATVLENKYQELLDSESTNADEQANSQVEEPANKVNSGPVASEAETSQGPGHLDLHAPTDTHQFAEPISAPLEESIIEESEEARLAPLATHHEDEGDAKQAELISETVSAGLDVTEGQDSITEKAVPSSDHEQFAKDGDGIQPGDNAQPEDNNTINIEEENVGSLLDGKEKTGEDALANSQVVEEGLPITEEGPAVPVIESALPGPSVECDSGTTVDAVNDKAISVENVGDNVEGAVNVMPTSEVASVVPVIDSITPELGLSDSCVEGDIVMADVAVESNALPLEGVSNEEALEEELPIKGVVSALQELESASPEVALPEPSTESKSGIAADTVEKALSADLVDAELAPDETQIDKPSAGCESGVADFTVDDNATPTENDVPNVEGVGDGQLITQEVSTVPEAESDSQELALSNPSVEREIEEVDVAPDDKTHPEEDLSNEQVVEEGLPTKEEVCAVPDVESASAEKTLPEPSVELDSKVKADPSEDIAAEDLPVFPEEASTQIQPAATLSENKYQELLDSDSTNADEQANPQVEEPASKVNSGPVASEAETSQGPGHLDLHAPTATHQFAEPISAPLGESINEESEEARLAPLATHHEDEGDAKQAELISETVSAGLDVTEGQDSITEKAVPSSDHEQLAKDGDEIQPGDNAQPEDNNTINIEEENVGSLLDGKEETGEDALAISHVVKEGLPITEEVLAVPVIESALTGTSVECDGGTTVDEVNDKAISVENVGDIVEGAVNIMPASEDASAVPVIESTTPELGLSDSCVEGDIVITDVAVESNALPLEGVSNEEALEDELPIKEIVSTLQELESASPEVALPEPSTESKSGIAADTVEKALSADLVDAELAPDETQIDKPSAGCESGVADFTVDDNATPTENVVPNVEGVGDGQLITQEVSTVPEAESDSQELALSNPSVEREIEEVDVAPDDKTHPEEDLSNEQVVEEGLPTKEEVCAVPDVESASAEKTLPEPSVELDSKVKADPSEDIAAEDLPVVSEEASTQDQPAATLSENKYQELLDSESTNADEQANSQVEEPANKVNSGLVASEAERSQSPGHLDLHAPTATHQFAEPISAPLEELIIEESEEARLAQLATHHEDEGDAKQAELISETVSAGPNIAEGQDSITEKAVPSSDHEQFAKDGDEIKPGDNAHPEDNNTINIEEENVGSLLDGKEETGEDALANSQVVEEGLPITEEGPAVPVIESALPGPSVECDSGTTVDAVNDKAISVENVGDNVEGAVNVMPTSEDASAVPVIESTTPEVGLSDSCVEGDIVITDDAVESNALPVKGVSNEEALEDELPIKEVVSTLQELESASPEVALPEPSTESKSGIAAGTVEKDLPADLVNAELAPDETQIDKPSAECESGVADFTVDDNATPTENVVPNVEGLGDGQLITQEVSTVPEAESDSQELALSNPSVEREIEEVDVALDDKTNPGEDLSNEQVVEEGLSIKEEVCAVPDVESASAEKTLLEPSVELDSKVKADPSEDIAAEDLPVFPEEASTQDQPAATLSENKYQELLDSDSTNADEQANPQVEEPASKVNSGPVASEAETSQGPGHLDLHAPTATHQFAEPISAPLGESINEESEEARLAPLATHHEDEGDAKQAELISETVSAGLDVTEGQDSITEKAVPSSDHEQFAKDGDGIQPGDNAQPEDNNTINIEEENVGSLLDGKEKTGEDALANSQVVEEGLPITEEGPAVPVIESALPGPSVECDSGTTVDAVNDKAISVENVGDNVEGAVNVMPTSEDASAVPVIESTTPELGLSDSCVEGDIVIADVAVQSNALPVEGVSNEEALEDELPIKEVVSALQGLESASPEVALPEPSTESKSGIAADTVEKDLSADLVNAELAPDETQIVKPSAECESGVADFTVDDNTTSTENVVPNVEGLGDGQPITPEVSTPPETESDSQELALSNPSVEREIEEVDVALDDKTHPGEDLSNEQVVEEGLSIKEEVCAVPDVESASAEKTLPEPSVELDSKVKADPSEDIAAEDLPVVPEEASTQDQPAATLSENKHQDLLDSESTNADEQANSQVEEPANKVNSGLVASEAETSQGPGHLDLHDPTATPQFAEPISAHLEESINEESEEARLAQLATHHEDEGDAKQAELKSETVSAGLDVTEGQDSITEKAVPSSDHEQFAKDGDEIKPVDNAHPEDNNTINIEEENVGSLLDGKEETGEDALANSQVVEEGLPITEEGPAVPVIESALPGPSVECDSGTTVDAVNDKAISVENVGDNVEGAVNVMLTSEVASVVPVIDSITPELGLSDSCVEGDIVMADVAVESNALPLEGVSNEEALEEELPIKGVVSALQELESASPEVALPEPPTESKSGIAADTVEKALSADLVDAELAPGETEFRKLEPVEVIPAEKCNVETNVEAHSKESTLAKELPVISGEDGNLQSDKLNIYYSSLPAFLVTPTPSFISIPRPSVDPATIARVRPTPPIVTNIKREVILAPRMKKMSTISIESTRASILRQFKNSFNGSSNYKISAAETHLNASSNPTSIAETAVDTLSRSKSEEKVRLCNKETSRPTRRLTKRHPNQTRQSFAPSRIPISTASKDRRAKSSAPPSSSTRDDLCYTTPAGTSSLSPSKSILKGRHSCENTSSSRVRSKVTVIQPLFSNERSFSKRVARDAEPPASRSSSSASSLHLREVDSFTLIERSDVPVGRTPRNLNVNPPLSRRLSTSVKEIMQKRQSRIVASKKTSNSLYEIPLGDDFHLDIENELDNILNAVEADNRENPDDGGLVNSEVDKSFDADNSQIRRPSGDSRRSFLSSSTCDDPKGKKTHKIRRKIAVAAVSLADKIVKNLDPDL